MDLRDLADELVARDHRDAAPFALHIVPSADPAAEIARHVERSVFMEFFGNSPDLLAEEYAPYEAGSVFFVVLDQALRTPAGAMRVVLPHGGNKTLDDLAGAWRTDVDDVLARSCPTFRREKAWDVATVAVMPDYRRSSTSGLIALSLYQAVARLSVVHDIDWLLAVLDLVVLDLIQSLISRPFQRFAGVEPMSYLDSPSSLPVFIDMAEYRPRLRLTDPNMFDILFEGRGLEAGVAPPPWLTAPLEGAVPLRRAN